VDLLAFFGFEGPGLCYGKEKLRQLRSVQYMGYVHLRLMPGVSTHYISEAAGLADSVGINLEAVGKSVFSELCPDKGGLKEARTVLKRLD